MTNKPKHTPGPWKFEFEVDSECGCATAIVHFDADNNQMLTCDCASKEEQQELEANARLIAAAPELLEQLKLVQAYLSTKGQVWTGIDAAIRKAEGTKPPPKYLVTSLGSRKAEGSEK